MPRVPMFYLQKDGFEVRPCFVRFEKPHPHEVGVVVNGREAVLNTMWGRNIHMAPQVT
jgi:hypothetical protein